MSKLFRRLVYTVLIIFGMPIAAISLSVYFLGVAILDLAAKWDTP